MFEILPRDWNLKPFFTQKWASVDMNWGGGLSPNRFNPPTLPPIIPTLRLQNMPGNNAGRTTELAIRIKALKWPWSSVKRSIGDQCSSDSSGATAVYLTQWRNAARIYDNWPLSAAGWRRSNVITAPLSAQRRRRRTISRCLCIRSHPPGFTQLRPSLCGRIER